MGRGDVAKFIIIVLCLFAGFVWVKFGEFGSNSAVWQHKIFLIVHQTLFLGGSRCY